MRRTPPGGIIVEMSDDVGPPTDTAAPTVPTAVLERVARFEERGEALARVKQQHIEQLHIPVYNVDRTRHDHLVTLVQRMLDLHKRLPELKSAHDRTLTQRQIEATDREIDRLVYELYELTDEEIGIVEGRGG